MMNEQKTRLEIQREQELKESNLDWEIKVINIQPAGKVTSVFNSKENELEQVIHKLKLDLITAIRFGYEEPFVVVVKRKIKSKY